MKILSFIKLHRAKVISVVVAVVLVASLVTAIAVLAKPKESEAVGIIDGAELSGGVLRYSADTDAYFTKAFRTYYDKMFADMFKTFSIKQSATEVISPDDFANSLLIAMRNGGVTSDKVLAFAYYLENVDSGDILEYIILSYLVPYVDENGNNVYDSEGHMYYTIGDKADVSVLYDNGISFTKAISDVVENTTITAEDIGNIFYYALLDTAEGEYKEVLEKLSAEGFRALFVYGSDIYSLVSSLEKGASISEIRVALELIYEVGVQYNKIVRDLGVGGIKILANGINIEGGDLGLDGTVANNLNKVGDVTPLIISTLGKTFTSIDGKLATAIAAWVNNEDDEAYSYTAVNLADAFVRSLSEAQAEVGITEDEAVNYLSTILGTLEYLEEESLEEATVQGELDAHIQNNKTSLVEDLSLIKSLASYSSIIPQDFTSGCISVENVREIKELCSKLEFKSDSALDGVNKIGSFAIYNILLSLVVNLYEG